MASDLIYCGYDQCEDCVTELKTEYPNAEIENASDEIHGGRFSIEVSDIDDAEFYLFLLRRGYLDISLKLGMLKHISPEKFNNLLEMVISEKKLTREETTNDLFYL